MNNEVKTKVSLTASFPQSIPHHSVFACRSLTNICAAFSQTEQLISVCFVSVSGTKWASNSLWFRPRKSLHNSWKSIQYLSKYSHVWNWQTTHSRLIKNNNKRLKCLFIWLFVLPVLHLSFLQQMKCFGDDWMKDLVTSGQLCLEALKHQNRSGLHLSVRLLSLSVSLLIIT